MSDNVTATLGLHAVVPAIVLEDANQSAPLAHALISGGLPVAEITLRTPAALDALRRMAAFGNLLVGAGTVVNVTQAEQAVGAGARFLVSPGMDETLIKWCLERGVPIFPGAITPTEVMLATNLGLGCVKFFPCEASGGLATLKALRGPFPAMRFMPTGGVTIESLPNYLSFRPVLAVGGTWMVRSEWLRDDRFDLIEEACQSTVGAVVETRRKLALAARGASA
jgi:2-dehydro-3-deoxyphosphogluconate aldolase / (4S)-4-hydroxy-2-oxoglutarate aldolase